MFFKQKIGFLESSKFKNYIAYALGEVLLIVIGISIAVIINNYVEKNNQQKLLNSIFATIENDINSDLLEVDVILDNYEKMEPLFDFVLDSLDQGNSMKDCLRCPAVLTSVMPFTMHTRGYQQLLNYKAYNLSHSDSLIFDVSNFYSSFKKLSDIVNEMLLEDTNENLDYLKLNYVHFKDMNTSKDILGRMDFFENNIQFVNRVALREVYNYANHVQLLESYKKESNSLLKEIKKRIK